MDDRDSIVPIEKDLCQILFAVDRVGGRNRRGATAAWIFLSYENQKPAKATASGGGAGTFPRPAHHERLEVLLRDAEQARVGLTG